MTHPAARLVTEAGTITGTVPGRRPARFGRHRLHPAWPVAAVTFLALIAAAAFRSSTGVLIEPVEAEFGWSRSWISGAVSTNLVLFGLTAPFAAALMDRFGVRRVVAVALSLVALGSGLTLVMTQPWHLMVLWGFVVGFGTGSMALVFGAIVANRWFVERRGLVVGVFSAGSATGQLVVLPVVAYLATHAGWRRASGLTAALALAIVPLVLWLLHDRPEDIGLRPYGSPPAPMAPVVEVVAPVEMVAPVEVMAPVESAPRPKRDGPGRIALRQLRLAARTRAFWILFGTFFICGQYLIECVLGFLANLARPLVGVERRLVPAVRR